jgi:hypothetical protein
MEWKVNIHDRTQECDEQSNCKEADKKFFLHYSNAGYHFFMYYSIINKVPHLFGEGACSRRTDNGTDIKKEWLAPPPSPLFVTFIC